MQNDSHRDPRIEALDQHRDRCVDAIEHLVAGGAQSSELKKLKSEFGSEVAGMIGAVAGLQKRARAKLGEGIWWVTDKSLQQSTPWQVAKLKADWFAPDHVYDLCSGIGGDASALATHHSVTAIDVDPLVAAMCRANLATHAPAGASTVLANDVTTVDYPSASQFHIDPDRRSEGQRTTSPEHYRPTWIEVGGWIENCSGAIVKLAPVTEPLDTPAPFHRCLISLQGTVREQSLLFGECIERAGVAEGTTSAWRVFADTTASRFEASTVDDANVPSVDRPQDFLVDPDASVRAAKLTGALAVAGGLSTLGGPTGFLTSTEPPGANVHSMCFVGRVVWSGTADDRKLRKTLRSLDAHPQTIKVRGSDHNPNVLTKRYRGCGEKPLVLWIGRAGGRVYAALTEQPGE